MVDFDGTTTIGSLFTSNVNRTTSSFSSTIQPAYPQAHKTFPERKGQTPGGLNKTSDALEEISKNPELLQEPNHPHGEPFSRSLQFWIDTQTQKIVAALVDDATGEIIRQFPLDENGVFKLVEQPFNAVLVNVYT